MVWGSFISPPFTPPPQTHNCPTSQSSPSPPLFANSLSLTHTHPSPPTLSALQPSFSADASPSFSNTVQGRGRREEEEEMDHKKEGIADEEVGQLSNHRRGRS